MSCDHFNLRVEIEQAKDPTARTPRAYERGRIAKALRLNPEFVDLPKRKRGRKIGFHFNRN